MPNILVALDRDGTLHKDVGYLGKHKDWKYEVEIYHDVPEAIRRLNKMKIPVVVISNQAGVARGFFACDRVVE